VFGVAVSFIVMVFAPHTLQHLHFLKDRKKCNSCKPTHKKQKPLPKKLAEAK
jgi:hypothetical protein